MDMTPSQFTFTFLEHSAERQRDVAKEKGLVFFNLVDFKHH